MLTKCDTCMRAIYYWYSLVYLVALVSAQKLSNHCGFCIRCRWSHCRRRQWRRFDESVKTACRPEAGWFGVPHATYPNFISAGGPDSEHGVTPTRVRGFDLSHHQSKLLTEAELRAAHAVYCVSQGHVDYIQSRLGGGEHQNPHQKLKNLPQ